MRAFTISTEDNPVFVLERHEMPITAADYGKVVRVGGDLGPGAECGGATCYPMTYGADADVITLRSSMSDLGGMCLVYVGPVGASLGPVDPGGVQLRLDAVNSDWLLR